MAVTDDAIVKIKDMIRSGELGPGDRLPPEKDLSAHLGLSRNSLREAVKALQTIRVLDVRQGDGTYVTSLEPKLLLEAISFVVEMQDDSTVLEVFGVRRLLEPAAARQAAGAATPEDIQRLRAIVDAVDRSSTIEELVQHDIAFHQGISELCGNRYLTSLIDGLANQTVRARVWRGITQEDAVQRTLDEHHRILDALEAGDGDLVQALVLVHVSGVEQWLRQVQHDA